MGSNPCVSDYQTLCSFFSNRLFFYRQKPEIIAPSVIIKALNKIQSNYSINYNNYQQKRFISEPFLNSEKMGFEPMRQITPPNTLAGCRLQPTRPLLLLIRFPLFYHKLFFVQILYP